MVLKCWSLRITNSGRNINLVIIVSVILVLLSRIQKAYSGDTIQVSEIKEREGFQRESVQERVSRVQSVPGFAKVSSYYSKFLSSKNACQRF